MKKLVSMVLMVTIVMAPSAASAAKPDGWKVVGGVVERFSAATEDGRTFVFQVNECTHPQKGMGTLVTVERPGRPPARSVLPHSEIPEYGDAAVKNYNTVAGGIIPRGWTSWLPNGIGGFLQKWIDFGERILKAVKKAAKGVQLVVEAVCDISGALGWDLNDRLEDELDTKFVADKMARFADLKLTDSVAKRVAYDLKHTIAADKSKKAAVVVAQWILDGSTK